MNFIDMTLKAACLRTAGRTALSRRPAPGWVAVRWGVRALAVVAVLAAAIPSAHASLVGDLVTLGIQVQSGVGSIVVGPTGIIGDGDEFVVTQTVGPSLLVTHTIDLSGSGLTIRTTSTGSGGGSTSIRFQFTSVDTGAPITAFHQTAGLNQILNANATANSITFDLGFFTSASEPRMTSLAIVSAQPSALMEMDLLAPGDGLITRDTETGLDWLDVSVTSGRSYSDIEADVGGWASLGFRHATGTEVCRLLTTYAAAPASRCPTGNVAVTGRNIASLHEQVEAFAALFAATTCESGCAHFADNYVAVEGWFNDEQGTLLAGQVTLFYTTETNQTSVGVRNAADAQTFAPAQYGNWLVRQAQAPDDDDDDDDGVADIDDNCPSIANADQTDTDHDGAGDACDPDDDNDGIHDTVDNCSLVANASQADADGDGFGDSCDADLDGDGFANEVDNCPAASNTDQTDTDHDGIGDECDTDDDNDGIQDAADNCTSVPNLGQGDLDGDGIGDTCDVDLDGDGTNNETDNCPIDANVGQDDTDGDSQGDVCDADADNDTVANGSDNCPLVANLNQVDSDGDGQGEVCDSDLDGDGMANGADNCPNVANSGQTDFDGDGQGDVCDNDADDDGVSNGSDQCAATPVGATIDPTNGCSIVQLCPCEGPRGTVMPWRNHGKYVSCVAHAADELSNKGLISIAQNDGMVSAAGQSSCGQ